MIDTKLLFRFILGNNEDKQSSMKNFLPLSFSLFKIFSGNLKKKFIYWCLFLFFFFFAQMLKKLFIFDWSFSSIM